MQSVEHATYLLYDQVADTVLKRGNSVIFGGYLRDKIIHDNAAQKFYDIMHNDGQGTYSIAELTAKYNDKTLLPELSDRFLCPSDIDCIMPHSSIDDLLDAFKGQLLRVREIVRSSDHDYIGTKKDAAGFGPLADTKVEIRSFCIGFSMNPILASMSKSMNNVFVYLDIVDGHGGDANNGYFPEQMKSDFRCNGLYMGGDKQMRISPVLMETRFGDMNILGTHHCMMSIVNEILEKKAVMASGLMYDIRASELDCKVDLDAHRVHKMLSKGFTVTGLPHKMQILKKDDAYVTKADVCVICMDKFTKKVKGSGSCADKKMFVQTPVVRRTCCKTTYHVECMLQMCNSDHFNKQCPQCRDQFVKN